jgi:hypothetical protein
MVDWIPKPAVAIAPVSSKQTAEKVDNHQTIIKHSKDRPSGHWIIQTIDK